MVEPGAAILEQIISTLRTSVRKGQPFGVHCVVVRGSFIEGNTYLWPVKPDNTFDQVDGSSFCQRLRELAEHPLLIRLITCQSGDGITTDNGAPAAIRPCLTEASVPAVIAMRLIERLVPALCQELQHHGIIDAAMTVARGTVRDLPDSWMPALYSCLKSGRIWYVPSFADG
ncbi:CHAT domain-containing protein [Chloroflexus sp.]|uniref:CHAT domain-containing protein n=1 Tax=Chloroflexus sp. TaxID=1904827 RepID=UPI00404A1436